jgi:integrase
MGTITERQRKDGTSAFTAQIRLRIDGQPYSEAQTFHRRKLAEVWLVKRESELAKGLPTPESPLLLRELIDRYLTTFTLTNDKVTQFKLMLRDEVVNLNVKDYSASDIIAYVRRRRNMMGYRRTTRISASTVQHELSYLHQLFVIARTEWNEPIDQKPLDDALTYCRNQRLAAHSQKRERRISDDEIERLKAHYSLGSQEIPMGDLIEFALYSTRRVSEICRVRWEDFDEVKKTLIVRDVKHPRKREGNDRNSRLTNEAIIVIQRQPKVNERIFPYKENSISSSFYRACSILGLENLRFHDLRHEAITRLFERGYAIHEVALFSLHQSWEHLRRYTHLKPEDLVDR